MIPSLELDDMSHSPPDTVHGQHSLENRVISEPSKSITAHGPMSCRCSPNGRNLVICIDGTSNQFGRKNTNVIELYSQIMKKAGDRQLTYYNSGIGTYAKSRVKALAYWKQRFWHKVDLAFAINFDKIVVAAYRWLSENYEENDRIYMFGFSRGAHQVRTLAAMIEKVGLIHKGNEEQIPFAYELYLDAESDVEGGLSSPERIVKQSEHESTTSAGRFKETFSRENVRVHFVGVWDTVSSIGVARGKDLPKVHDASHICFFRHALALDERRVKFLPEYVHGGEGPTTEELNSLHVKEVWFPGTHSDVGGGNLDNPDLNLGRPSLQWMSYEAISAGLRLNPQKVEWDWKTLGDIQESLTGWWKLFERLPIKRLSYDDRTSVTSSAHIGKGRRIKPHQKIHSSIAFCKPDPENPTECYFPKAISDDLDLSKLVGIGEPDNMDWARIPILELDIFDLTAAKDVLTTLAPPDNQSEAAIVSWVIPKYGVARLETLARSDEGCAALLQVEAAIHSITRCLKFADSEVKPRVLKVLSQLQEHPAFTASPEDVTLSFLAIIRSKDQIADPMRSKAALHLSRLVLNSESRGHLRSDPIGDCLADLLTKGDTVQEDSWRAIRELLKYKDLHTSLFTINMNEAVWNSATHSIHDSDIGRQTLEILPIAMHHDKVQRDFNESAIEAARRWLSQEGIPSFRMMAVAMFYDTLRRQVLNVATFKDVWSYVLDGNQGVTRAALKILQLATQHHTTHKMVFHKFPIETVIQRALDDDSSYTRCETLKILGLLAQRSYCQDCKAMFDNGLVDAILERLNDRFEDVRDEARITLGLVVKHGIRAPGANANIRHLLYNIGWHDGQKSDPLVHGLQQKTNIHRGLRLFALVIGINNYQHLAGLRWAVHDADAINNFLQQDLEVPENHIINFRNWEASAKNIIEAFHRLEKDSRINAGDAIFIYYAGHGMPEDLVGLKAGGNNIQAIVPPGQTNGLDGIDRAVPINPLLNSLSREKGNNITVVLDCSHASSGPRRLSRRKGQQTPVIGCLQRDRRSHVLFAACCANETAGETEGGGVFTTAFLTTLKAARKKGDRLTYVGLIHKLPLIYPFRQNPQCEGRYKNRVFFNEKSSGSNSFFMRLRKGATARTGEQRWTLEAGDAQGITVGAELDGYVDHIECQSNRRICRLRVIETEASEATLECFDREGSAELAYARQVRCGSEIDLRVHITPAILEDVSVSDIKSVIPNDGFGFSYVADEKQAELLVELVSENHGNKAAAFSYRQSQLVRVNHEGGNIWRLPHVVPVTVMDISYVLRSMARWNWHLSRGPKEQAKVPPPVQLEVTRLEHVDGAFDMEGMPILEPVGGNLNDNGVVVVKDMDHLFGINIINSSTISYYPYLFYFDANDQSIEPYHIGATGSDHGNINAPLRDGSCLAVGYGTNGDFPLTFKLRDGEKRNLGFFKAFITNEPVDFGSLEQVSPFIGVRRRHGFSSESLVMTHIMNTTMHTSSDVVVEKRPATAGSDSVATGQRGAHPASEIRRRFNPLWNTWSSDVVAFLQC